MIQIHFLLESGVIALIGSVIGILGTIIGWNIFKTLEMKPLQLHLVFLALQLL